MIVDTEESPTLTTTTTTTKQKRGVDQIDGGIGLSVTRIGQPLAKQRRLQLPARARRRPAVARDMCEDNWRLDCSRRSREAVLNSSTSVLFHPRWSNGHAAVAGSRPLDRSLVHYWEVALGDRLFGTAMQVGVCTGLAELHADEFLPNLIGRDRHSWGLSHQGLAWHAGECRRLCDAFAENTACVVGVLFDGPAGVLSFFKDGAPLGRAFDNFNEIEEPLYPVLSSTAAKTSMTVTRRLRSYASLQDRCCATLARAAAGRAAVLHKSCPLPPMLRKLVLSRM